jgi:hypothetical protein
VRKVFFYDTRSYKELIRCTDPFSIIYFLFFFLSSLVTIFISFYPVPRPFHELNWPRTDEATILPSMCEYSNPDPDLIKHLHQILLDIRTDICLYSVGPSYKMTDGTAGPSIFDTSEILSVLLKSVHHLQHWCSDNKKKERIEDLIFSSPELKAQVSYSDRLLSVVRPSVHLSVNFSHFRLLLQNHLANFNQTWHKSSLREGGSSLFK